MSTKFLSPGWRMPRNANQSKSTNYSLDFDGGDHINAGRILSAENTSTLSVSFWLKIPSINAKSYLGYFIGNFGAGWLIEGGPTSISFALGDTTTGYQSFTLPYSGNIIINTWYHITMVFDGAQAQSVDKLKVYLNGKQKNLSGSPNFPSSIPTLSGAEFTIGGIRPTTVNGVKSISSVSIFDYALSESQATTLYGTGSAIGNPMALPRTPIAYYPLGESAGGFVGGTGTWLTENNAIGDYVFDFSGLQNIDCTNNSSLTPTSAISISLWVKTSDTGNFVGLVDKWNGTSSTGYMIDLGPSGSNQGKARFSISNQNSVVTTVAINDGAWHHIVATCDNTDGFIYLDGVQNSTGSLTMTGITNSDNLKIASDNSSTLGFNGEISNVQLFNTALSGPEATTLYNYGSPIQTLANIPQSSNLKAWYKLDATEIYNSTSTEWEVSDATAAIKNTILDPKNSISRPYYEEITGANLLPLTGTAGQSITISFWYYADGNADNIMFSRVQGGAYWFGKESTNNLRFLFTNNSGWTLGPSVPRDQWNHIVLTVTESGTSAGRTVKFYVNGGSPTTVTDSFSNLTNFPVPSSAKNTFGVGSTGSTNVDVLSSNYIYYNTALLDSEVTNLYNSFSPDSENTPTVQPALSDFPKDSNITGWFKSDGLDSSGEGNNASSVGNILIGPAVSLRNGKSSGMSQSNLVQSDLQTVAPYSKYAMNFDFDYIDLGSDSSLDIAGNDFSCSLWFNTTTTANGQALFALEAFSNKFAMTIEGGAAYKNVAFSFNWNTGGFPTYYYNGGNNLTDGNWHNYIITKQGTTVQAYIDGSTITFGNLNGSASSSNANRIARWYHGRYSGKISNTSLWDKQLSSSEVREIYNQGLPSNLNSHSAYSNLVSWWQLGENSSFNGNDWIVADEIGSNNGLSNSMPVGALTNGVGTTANGTSYSMWEGSLIGDAPYSTANAISSGMAVQAFDSETPPNVISGRSEDVPS